MAITRLGWDVLAPNSSRLDPLPWITGKVRDGDAWVILNELGRRFNKDVEKITKAWSWGYAQRDVRGQGGIASEHSAGAAVDFNAPLHGLGKSGTFSAAEVRAIRRILKDLDGAVRWGGDYAGRKDEMHFELQGGVVKLKKVADKIRGGVAPVITPPKKPKPALVDHSGTWPEQPLKVTDKHTKQSDAAWRELMQAIGYTHKDLGVNLQTWLSELEDPRTGKAYYPTDKFRIDGDFGKESVKALQRKLYDSEDDKGRRLYNGAADGGRGPLTVRAEIGYLNTKANRGIK